MNLTFLWYFLCPVLILPFIWRRFRSPVSEHIEKQALCVPFFKQIQQEIHSDKLYSGKTKYAVLFWIGWMFFVLALMRPVVYQDGFFAPNKARQVMLVLDVSGSMAQQDFILNGVAMSRLSAVKELAEKFIIDRKGDAVGLTIFGTEPYIYVPLTQDVKTAQNMLHEVDVGIAGERTAMADALGLALKQMNNIPADEKVIVLFSDGAANAGILHPDEVLKMAKQMNVKVYTIGLGSQEQIVDFGIFKQRINPSADLDEKLLKDIAAQTNAQYFRVKTTEDMQEMYAQLDKLEPVDTEGQFIRPHKELFWYSLAVSMLCFLIGFFFKKRYS